MPLIRFLGLTLLLSLSSFAFAGADVPDTTDPELTSFAIEPASQIISTESENLITVKVGALDNESGVAEVAVGINYPGVEGSCPSTYVRPSYDEDSGLWVGSLALGNDSAPGTYSVCTLWIKDSVASTPNLRIYRESELIELGYTLSTIVDYLDSDSDRTGNNADNCPNVSNADQLNTDGDIEGDVCDQDDDNDGVADSDDAFPLDAAESVDTDADGIGNNADTDDDGDGVADIYDDFPEDPSESSDTDLDGVGDNIDNCLVVPNSDQIDGDNDSIGDACEVQTVVADLPDEGLRSCLANVTAQSLEEVKELDCSSRGITSIAGIEQFYRLTKLDLSSNPIENLVPLIELSSLDDLQISSLQSNVALAPISELALKSLVIHNMGLDSLEDWLPKQGTLEFLKMQSNEISDLGPLSSQPGLTMLDIIHNDRIDWATFPSNLNKLIIFRAHNTNLESTVQLPAYLGQTIEVLYIGGHGARMKNLSGLEPFDQLRELWVHYNSDLDWSSLPVMESLERLYAYETGIQSLHQLAILKDGLQYLNVAHHSMENLDGIELFTELTGMNAAYNQISDLSHMIKPISLNLGGNQITDLTPLSIYSDASGLQIQLWDNPFRRIGDLFKGWTDIRISFEKQSSQTTEWLSCQEIDYVKSYLDESVTVEWPTYSDCWDDPDRDYLYELEDAFPMDVAASVDTDEDGKPDDWNEGFGASDSTSTPPLVLDLDDDNDSYVDGADAFPLDPTEWADFDDDGLGNNADTDDDNDGVLDTADAFPYDAQYSQDDDQDGLPDSWEAQYGLDSQNANDAFEDTDQDGYLNWEEFLLETDPTVADGTAQLVFTDKPATLIPGRVSRFTVQYSTVDNNPNLSGLGLRVHYNSNYVTSVALETILETGFVAVSEPEADTFDLDGDAETDQFILISWASFSGPAWPGEIPKDLFDVVITTTENMADLDFYPIRFSIAASSEGYTVSAPSVYNPVVLASLDIDGDGSAKALSDGLMVIRRMFGFSGMTLINGAVSAEAIYASPEAIAERIDAFSEGFDVDANGETKALSDGLMIIRRLFGFSGETLVAGAVAPDATRTDPNEIADYIDSLSP